MVGPPVEHSERRIFDKYTLIAQLAKGGMGEICVARLRGAAGFEKLVVIKRMLPHLAEDGRYIAMLRDEARIAARLSHQNICQVLDFGEVDGQYYIAMEYLEGVVMSDLLRRLSHEGALVDPRLATEIVIQACKGLDAAHELTDRSGKPLDLVHRDISPSNLFITSAGLVKVLDFGIAKTPDTTNTTRTGAVKGKWAYMSPEQVLRKPLDRRSDIFSLGVVLYEGLTGQRLFRRPSEYEICRAITETDAPSVREHRPELSEELAGVVSRALSREPDARFATANELAKALHKAMAPFGGPGSLSELAEFIAARFQAEIEERRRFIESVEIKDEAELGRGNLGPLPMAPNPFSHITGGDRVRSNGSALRDEDDELPTQDTRSLMPSDRPSPELMATPPPGATRDTSVPGRGRAAVKPWMLAAIVLVAAVGGTLAYMKSRSRVAPPVTAQVVVEHGNASTDSIDAGNPGVAVLPALDAGLPGDAGALDAGRKKTNRPKDKGRYGQSHYEKVFKRKLAKVRECFAKHAAIEAGAPVIEVTIGIAQSGRPETVSLSSSDIESTELGQCVVGVVKTMRFGKHDEMVEVTIPFAVRGK